MRLIRKDFLLIKIMMFVCSFFSAAVFSHASDPALATAIAGFPETRAGLYVHVNCRDEELACEFINGKALLVDCAVLDTSYLAGIRNQIKAQNLYGKVCARECGRSRLNYSDNTANFLILEDVKMVLDSGITLKDAMRVVCPRGMAFIGRRSGGDLSQWELESMLADAGITDYQIITENGLWAKAIKPFPPEMDEWTHFRHSADGNSVSRDSFAAPNTFKWIAGPHRKKCTENLNAYSNRATHFSVMSNGRIFYDENNVFEKEAVGVPVIYSIVARDANNGLLLWSRQIGYRPVRSSVLAIGDTLFLPVDNGGPLAGINGADGSIMTTYTSGGAVREAAYNDGSLIVLCDGPQWKVRSVNASSGALNWTYSPQSGASICVQNEFFYLSNRDIVIGEGKIFIFETQDGCYYATCLDEATGTQLWRTANALWNTNPGISLYGGGVLVAGRDGTLYGISGSNGAMLWNYTYTMVSSYEPNSYYVQGRVWIHHDTGGGPSSGWGQWRGINPITGVVEMTFNDGNNTDRFRCSSYSASKRFLMAGTMDFMDIETQSYSSFRAARTTCGLGYIRGNDLMYTFPNACRCHPNVKGYIASVHDSILEDTSGRLETGPLYSEIITDDMISNDEWPGFRRDSLRSCGTPYPVDISGFQIHWQAGAGDSLLCVERDETREELEIMTCPVIAGGRVFVVSNGAHELRTYDASNGALLWSYALGARCDSPPTIYKGRCILGCNDGWIYCLRGSDGELIWRFRAAREDNMIAVFGQLESSWPVSGSGTIHGGNIHFIAGRHADDGKGLWMYALNPATGDIIWENPVPPGRYVDQHGARNILVSDGKYLFMHSFLVDPADGNAYNEWYAEVRLKHRGIYLRGGKDDGLLTCEIVRKEGAVWSFGTTADPIVKGYYHAFDAKRVFNMEYALNYTDNSDKVCAYTYDTGGAVLQWEVSSPSALKHGKTQYINAMLLAENHLFAAGALDEDDRNTGEVWVYSTIDGSKLGEFGIDAPPVFNGMAAAYGRLYISTKDGKLICMSNEGPVSTVNPAVFYEQYNNDNQSVIKPLPNKSETAAGMDNGIIKLDAVSEPIPNSDIGRILMVKDYSGVGTAEAAVKDGDIITESRLEQKELIELQDTITVSGVTAEIRS
ncbi:MAG: PQQ-binding-like beta-propeller repeat protein, partial [bacterium]